MPIQAFLSQLRNSRYYSLMWLALLYVGVSTTTRIVLFFHSLPELDAPIEQLFMILPIGFFYDLVTCFYGFALFALYLFVIPQRLYQTVWHQRVMVLASFVCIFAMEGRNGISRDYKY